MNSDWSARLALVGPIGGWLFAAAYQVDAFYVCLVGGCILLALTAAVAGYFLSDRDARCVIASGRC